MHTVVLVLGDAGRSPRMQYHALSLTERPDDTVTFVGYAGERCADAVERKARIRKHFISPVLAGAPRALFLLWAPIKVLAQLIQLLWVLLVSVPVPDVILVQNPPSIPTLAVAWAAARVRGAKFVIDWHNFGYTILALTAGSGVAASVLVPLARWYERCFGRLGDAHLTVTRSMAAWLEAHWGIHGAVVLYDRAPSFFRPSDAAMTHRLWSSLQRRITGLPEVPALPRACMPAEGSETTHVSYVCAESGQAKLRPDRPLILVSSTSWTPDEDFGVLANALVAYDAACVSQRRAVPASAKLPNIVAIITGKGPMRAQWEAKFADMQLKHVHITTAWLEAGQYPILLGAADVGVSLHTSSSGLDLPMKVVDMFGAHLPPLAVNFQCLDELISDGRTGRVFGTPAELAEQVKQIGAGFPWPASKYTAVRESGRATRDQDAPGSAPELLQLRQGIAAAGAASWADNWNEHARPVIAGHT